MSGRLSHAYARRLISVWQLNPAVQNELSEYPVGRLAYFECDCLFSEHESTFHAVDNSKSTGKSDQNTNPKIANASIPVDLVSTEAVLPSGGKDSGTEDGGDCANGGG